MNERKKAKSYTAEFKESAVKLAVESKRPLAQTARELGGSKDTLHGWVRQDHGKPQSGQEAVNSATQDHQTVFSVSRMCRIFEVSRSGFYEWTGRPESARKQVDNRVAGEIEQAFEDGRGS